MDSGQKQAVLASCGLVHMLDNAALARLASSGQEVQAGAGYTVLCKGQTSPGLYVVVRGAVKLYLSAPTGKEFCLAVVGRSMPIDGVGPLARSTAPLHAITTEATTLLLIPQQALELAMSAQQRAEAMNLHLIERQRQLMDLLEDVTLHTLDVRVARVLHRLYLHSMHNAAARLHRLDQSLLASMANGSRSKVNEHLQTLRRLGAIEIHGGAIVIRRLDLLASMTSPPSTAASVT